MIPVAVTALLLAVDLFPVPQRVIEESRGTFAVPDPLSIVLADRPSPALQSELDSIADAAGVSLRIEASDGDSPDTPCIIAGVLDVHPLFERQRFRYYTRDVDSDRSEAYRVTVERDLVVVAGRGERGLAFGLRRLVQLAENHGRNWPRLIVRDWPAFRVRQVLGIAEEPRDLFVSEYTAASESDWGPSMLRAVPNASTVQFDCRIPGVAPRMVAAVEAVQRNSDSGSYPTLVLRHLRTPQARIAVHQLAAAELQDHGFGVAAPSAHASALRDAMGRLWNPNADRNLFLDFVNPALDTALVSPSFDVLLETFVAVLDEAALRPGHLEGLRNRLDDALDETELVLEIDASAVDRVESLWANLTSYLAIERDYARGGGSDVPRRLASLVTRQQTLDPSFPRERAERIVSTIEGQGVFVPASILFGIPLRPHRSIAPSPRGRYYDVPATPSVENQEGIVEATVDFLDPETAIERIDFETFGTTQIEVSVGLANTDLARTAAMAMAPTAIGGPMPLSDPVAGRWLRVAAQSSNEQAVLRSLRFVQAKPHARIRCTASETGPGNVARAFLCRDERRFAEAPTRARFSRNDRRLIVRIDAFEQRPFATFAEETDRDASLANDESITLMLRPNFDTAFLFATNPLGTPVDARNGDRDWGGAWTLDTRREAWGWRAEFQIDWESFGFDGAPLGETWRCNVYRNRVNAVREASAWTIGYDDVADDWGEVVFD